MDEETSEPTAERMRQVMRLHEVRTPLSVVVARVQLLRRRLRRGDDLAQVEAEVEAMEAALVRLVAAIERLDEPAE